MPSDPPALTPAPHLLLVEDEPLIQELVFTVLQEAGYTIAVANNGPQAVTLLETDARHLGGPITDIDLGQGADGWEVARKARSEVPGLPVIYISGLSCRQWASNGVSNSLMVSKAVRSG